MFGTLLVELEQEKRTPCIYTILERGIQLLAPSCWHLSWFGLVSPSCKLCSTLGIAFFPIAPDMLRLYGRSSFICISTDSSGSTLVHAV